MIMGLEGTAKNRRPMIRLPVVQVVYEKSKNPDPRVYINGGLTKIDTSRKTHQTKVMARKVQVRNRRARTPQRLYGDT
jgi:hypothetical protein